MIDRERLRQAYAKMWQMCLGLMISPLALLFIAWFVAQEGSDGSTGPGSGEMPAAWLLGFAALAVAFLAAAPLARALLRKRLVAPRPDTQQALQGHILVETFILMGLLEGAATTGFVAFFAGAPWWFYLVVLGLSYIGLAATFPRWSAWLRQAEELDLLVATRSVPASK